MKAILKLNNPLWKTQERRAILDRVVQQSGAELEAEIKQTILNSVPGGRVYRRGAIRRKIAKRDLEFFRSNKAIFKRKFTSLTRETTVVGYSFHRASAPGQAPARDSSGLAGSIRAKKRGQMRVKVSAGKNYAAALDNGTTTAGKSRNVTIKPRPFFRSTAEKFREKFKQNVADAMKEAI